MLRMVNSNNYILAEVSSYNHVLIIVVYNNKTLL